MCYEPDDKWCAETPSVSAKEDPIEYLSQVQLRRTLNRVSDNLVEKLVYGSGYDIIQNCELDTALRRLDYYTVRRKVTIPGLKVFWLDVADNADSYDQALYVAVQDILLNNSAELIWEVLAADRGGVQ